MTEKEKMVREIRMNLGKFLHSYYMRFGEKKYNVFVSKIGEKMASDYGEEFNADNLYIMEAEYVTLNSRVNGEVKVSPPKK